MYIPLFVSFFIFIQLPNKTNGFPTMYFLRHTDKNCLWTDEEKGSLNSPPSDINGPKANFYPNRLFRNPERGYYVPNPNK